MATSGRVGRLRWKGVLTWCNPAEWTLGCQPQPLALAAAVNTSPCLESSALNHYQQSELPSSAVVTSGHVGRLHWKGVLAWCDPTKWTLGCQPQPLALAAAANTSPCLESSALNHYQQRELLSSVVTMSGRVGRLHWKGVLAALGERLSHGTKLVTLSWSAVGGERDGECMREE